MQIRLLSTDGRMVHVGLGGRVSQGESKSETDPLVELLGVEVYQRTVLLDLSEAEMVDSSGIGWLLASHKKFQSGGGILICHSLPPMVLKVFRLMRIEQVISTAETRQEAVQLARRQSHE